MKETRYLISETAKLVQVEPHVLRYWEEELGLSIKRNEMGHRYYTDKDLEIFQKIKELKKEGLQLKTIKEKLHEKDEIPQVEEHRISGEGIIKQQKTEPEFQEEQIQVKIVTPRKFLTEQSFEKKEEKQKRRSEQPTKEERFQAIMERLIHDIELKKDVTEDWMKRSGDINNPEKWSPPRRKIAKRKNNVTVKGANSY